MSPPNTQFYLWPHAGNYNNMEYTTHTAAYFFVLKISFLNRLSVDKE